jgi:hypothetical protein
MAQARSARLERWVMRQIESWPDPKQVQAITYDADGNIYYGFR